MSKASLMMVVALAWLAGGSLAGADVVRAADRAKSVFDDDATPVKAIPKAKPKPVSKTAQRKRAALQQRVLLQQLEQRQQSGSVGQNLERLRQQQQETLRDQQRVQPRQSPPRQRVVVQPSDPLGQRLEGLRQQQSDTLRDQRNIQRQQQIETQDAIRRQRQP